MSVLYTGEGGAPSKASSSSLSSPESSMPDPAPRRRRTVNTDGPLRMDRRGRPIILPPEMRSVFWGFYQLATGIALLAAGPVLLARRGSHYLPTLAGRLGRPAAVPPRPPPRRGAPPRRLRRPQRPRRCGLPAVRARLRRPRLLPPPPAARPGADRGGLLAAGAARGP